MKMDHKTFCDIRHLKDFKKLSNNQQNFWAFRWPTEKDIEMFDIHTKQTLFTVGHDVHLAQYICDLHNMSNRLIEEIESKYDAQ
jgi:hypothetical protein